MSVIMSVIFLVNFFGNFHLWPEWGGGSGRWGAVFFAASFGTLHLWPEWGGGGGSTCSYISLLPSCSSAACGSLRLCPMWDLNRI